MTPGRDSGEAEEEGSILCYKGDVVYGLGPECNLLSKPTNSHNCTKLQESWFECVLI
jgi:hypothetical protein